MKLGFYDSMIDAMEKYGDRVVATDSFGDMTYSQLLSGADAYCDRLVQMGVKPGDHVGLCSFNSCAWLKAFMGIVKAKAVAVLLNYGLPVQEHQALMNQMDASVFLYGACGAEKKDPDFAAKIQPDEKLRLDIRTFDTPLRTNFERMNLTEAEFGAPAFTIFTSGSTGTPKGTLLSQRSSVNGAKAYLDLFPAFEKETFLLGVPLFHMFGYGLGMTHLMVGGRLLLPAAFDSRSMIAMAKEFSPNAMAAVMTVILRIIDDPDFPSDGLPSVRRIHCGGAPLMPIHLMRVETTFANATLLNNYGQTESDSCIATQTEADSAQIRTSCVGRPAPHRTIVIMDAQGRSCPVGEVGEVTLKDDGNICLGYYKVPEEKQCIDENGFLHTGDLGFLDEDGYLHLSGRIKDIIIKGGENVIPIEIESALSAIDGVSEVKVLGAPSEIYGENIEACVTLKSGFDYDEDTIKALLKGKVKTFYLPEHVFFFKEFPHKPNGKLDVCAVALEMLRLFNERRVEEDLNNGIQVLSFTAKCQKYLISSLYEAMEGFLPNLGFTRRKTMMIIHCLEEMLAERANKMYIDDGSFTMEFRLWPSFLRVTFSDDILKPAFLDAENNIERSAGLRIILAMADKVDHKTDQRGCHSYSFDFTFDTDFNTKEFFL